jgi:pyruvate,water dikinase
VQKKRCLWFQELSRVDVPIAGGKGANLGDMVQANLPVPPGFVITAPAYRDVVECSGLDYQIMEMLAGLDREDSNQLRRIEPEIRHLFQDCLIPDDLRETIWSYYAILGDQVPVAVRSSATAEDLAGASFAGQQETILNVLGQEALLEAVRRCFSSLFTSQAIFYRARQGFNDDEVSMAVVIQKMINSEKSGVTFTIDPVMKNRYQMIIEGVWGIGEGIVSGTITPDHYKLDRDTYEILYEFVPEKTIMYCKSDAAGVQVRPVPPDLVSARVLTDDELRILVDLGNKLEQHFGCPQDIEWAVEGGQIYLLQSRPITGL